MFVLSALNDDARRGVHGDVWLIAISSGRAALVLVCLAAVLYACFSRWPALLSDTRKIVVGYVLLLLASMPLQLMFVMKQWPGFQWEALEQQAAVIDKISYVLHWTTITAIYFAVVAIKSWQQKTRALAAGLALRLALEQQQGLALRAQLEPHFMFNALNAIGALVISGNRERALSGIDGFSDLLRYALGAAEREWVNIADELQFINDYLSLQQLRYGARLQLRIDGASAEVLQADCLPLLLQPLIENALRHDLDCHDDYSDILLALRCDDGRLDIHVSNPARPATVLNPGTGLGLRHIAARLQLAYGAAASMQTGIHDGRFTVSLHLPRHRMLER